MYVTSVCGQSIELFCDEWWIETHTEPFSVSISIVPLTCSNGSGYACICIHERDANLKRSVLWRADCLRDSDTGYFHSVCFAQNYNVSFWRDLLLISRVCEFSLPKIQKLSCHHATAGILLHDTSKIFRNRFPSFVCRVYCLCYVLWLFVVLEMSKIYTPEEYLKVALYDSEVRWSFWKPLYECVLRAILSLACTSTKYCFFLFSAWYA